MVCAGIFAQSWPSINPERGMRLSPREKAPRVEGTTVAAPPWCQVDACSNPKSQPSCWDLVFQVHVMRAIAITMSLWAIISQNRVNLKINQLDHHPVLTRHVTTHIHHVTSRAGVVPVAQAPYLVGLETKQITG